jgi:CBS domain containing-hemolysin-like protein
MVTLSDGKIARPSRTVLETVGFALLGFHSRIPIYEETVDNIIGLLYVKDLSAPGRKEPFDLRAMARPTFYVPEVMKISGLLREFQGRKTHMAIVVDEYGGTARLTEAEGQDAQDCESWRG